MTATKARAVRFDRYGGRDVLYVADIDTFMPVEPPCSFPLHSPPDPLGGFFILELFEIKKPCQC
jgi:hypothetical protein